MSSLGKASADFSRANREKIQFLDTMLRDIQMDRDISRIVEQRWREGALQAIGNFKQNRRDDEACKQVLDCLTSLFQQLPASSDSRKLILEFMAEFSKKFPIRGNKPHHF